MDTLQNLIKKKNKNVIGILSGTSIDAVSIVFVNIRGNGINSVVKVLDFQSYKIDKVLRQQILKNSRVNTSNVEEICRLNFVLGNLFADSINKFLKNRNIRNSEIDLIGSHGQTIHHLPQENRSFGFKTKSTLQIGDPSVIANLTGITTVGDFRTADVAVNGDGAPLVPFLDYILFRHKGKSRILLNIGGIANLTYLRKNCKVDDIIAFDTGPGNMMIDNMMRYLFNKDYDKNGGIAKKGNFNKELFKKIVKKDIYYNKKPPKSTGREYYEAVIFNYIKQNIKNIPNEDVIRTISYYTALTIVYNIKNFLQINDETEILISGGGSKNKMIVNLLKNLLPDFAIKSLEENGVNAENKEAVLFAVLANEAICGNPGNIKVVTNAKRNVILGKICPV